MSSQKVPISVDAKKALVKSVILSRIVYEYKPQWPKGRIFTEPTPSWAWSDDPKVLTDGNLATRQGELYPESERVALRKDMLDIIENLVFIEDVKSDTQCYVGVHKRVAYVIFRGSTTSTDWTKNVDWEMRDFENSTNGAKVHDGFYSDFNVIRERVFDQLNTQIDDFDTILSAGHSLGGAMAVVAAIIFHRFYKNKTIHMHSFAAPRVGNQAFCNEYNACAAGHATNSLRTNSWRLFIDHDVAPMVPYVNLLKVSTTFPWLTFPVLKYHHVEGNVIELTAKDVNNTHNVKGEPDNGKDGTLHALWLAPYAYSNHSYDLYVDRVMTLPTSQ